MAAFEPQIVNVSGTYTAAYGNKKIFVDTTSSAATINLPAIGSGVEQCAKGYEIEIIDEKYNAGQNSITITPNGTNKVDNATSGSIEEDGGRVILQSDGVSNWVEMVANRKQRPFQVFSVPFANDIDGKTVGTTNVFRVPQGKRAVFVGADVALKNKTGAVSAVGQGKFKIAGGADLTPDAALTGVTGVGDITHYSPLAAGSGAGSVVVGGAGGTWVQFSLTGAYSATAVTLAGSITGYFLN